MSAVSAPPWRLGNEKTQPRLGFFHLARPERFELPTLWFVARYSIQLSYGRVEVAHYMRFSLAVNAFYIGDGLGKVAESEGFEPSMGFWPILP